MQREAQQNKIKQRSKAKQSAAKKSPTHEVPSAAPRCQVCYSFLTGRLPGSLKAVWPDFLGAVLRSGRPRGHVKVLENVGAKHPTFWKALPGPRGRPDLKNATPKIRPDCVQVPREPDCLQVTRLRPGSGKTELF